MTATRPCTLEGPTGRSAVRPSSVALSLDYSNCTDSGRRTLIWSPRLALCGPRIAFLCVSVCVSAACSWRPTTGASAFDTCSCAISSSPRYGFAMGTRDRSSPPHSLDSSIPSPARHVRSFLVDLCSVVACALQLKSMIEIAKLANHNRSASAPPPPTLMTNRMRFQSLCLQFASLCFSVCHCHCCCHFLFCRLSAKWC